MFHTLTALRSHQARLHGFRYDVRKFIVGGACPIGCTVRIRVLVQCSMFAHRDPRCRVDILRGTLPKFTHECGQLLDAEMPSLPKLLVCLGNILVRLSFLLGRIVRPRSELVEDLCVRSSLLRLVVVFSVAAFCFGQSVLATCVA